MANTFSLYEDGAIDFARPPKEVIFERLNAINGTSFSPDDFSLTDVESVTGPNYDTQITALPVNTSMWSKGFTIKYSRVPIGEQMQHVAAVPTNSETNLYSILDTINAAYGIYLTEADVQDALINYNDPLDPEGSGNVQIVTRGTSIFFVSQITIPVNNTVSHGVSVYDDELVHYMAVRSGGFDQVVGRDALGQTLETFTFGVGVTWTSSNIKQLFKKPDGSLIVLGDFSYTAPTDFNGGGARTDKVLFLSTRGRIEDATAGSIFGLNYSGLEYIQDLANDRVYALDKQGTVGGNLHGILAFKGNGEVDSDFTSNLTRKVDALTTYNDQIYVGVREAAAGQNATLRRLLLNGTIDTTFPEVNLPLPSGRPVDNGRVTAIGASDRGVVVALKPITQSGNLSWEEHSHLTPAGGMAAPVIVVDHNGVVDPLFGKLHPLLTGYRAGVVMDNSKVALTTRAAVYLAKSCDLATGQIAVNPISVDQDGNITGSFNNANINEYPLFTNYVSVELSTRGDVIVAGNAMLLVNNVPETFMVVAAFDLHGFFAARLLAIPEKRLLAYAHHRFM